jgi:hypothetical protein
VSLLILLASLKGPCQLENVINLENDRLKTRFWFPSLSFHDFFHWSIWDHSVDLEREDDENPSRSHTSYIGSEWLIHDRWGKETHHVDLGAAQRRDPDALPPRNSFEAVMNTLHHAFRGISGGNQLFAIKAGILTSQHLNSDPVTALILLGQRYSVFRHSLDLLLLLHMVRSRKVSDDVPVVADCINC